MRGEGKCHVFTVGETVGQTERLLAPGQHQVKEREQHDSEAPAVALETTRFAPVDLKTCRVRCERSKRHHKDKPQVPCIVGYS